MDMHMSDFDGLLVTAAVPVQGSDQLELEPEQSYQHIAAPRRMA